MNVTSHAAGAIDGAPARFAPEHREIGRLVGRQPGPTLVVVGGMHGNEPGGGLAARRVLDRLARDSVEVCGELVALAGNLGALRAGRRYHVKDLNRQWGEERVQALASRPPGEDDAEDREQRELLAAIESAMRARARSRVPRRPSHDERAGHPLRHHGRHARAAQARRRVPAADRARTGRAARRRPLRVLDAPRVRDVRRRGGTAPRRRRRSTASRP